MFFFSEMSEYYENNMYLQNEDLETISSTLSTDDKNQKTKTRIPESRSNTDIINPTKPRLFPQVK